MRINRRLLFLILFLQTVVGIVLWCFAKNFLVAEDKENGYVLFRNTKQEQGHNALVKVSSQCQDIECVINGAYSINCKKVDENVYLPFSFIQKYFEVYGKLTESNGVQRFNWSHSYATVHFPKEKYDPRGTFTHFHNYRVEERERVKCVTATEGVPLSTQWNIRGYYYPTQIAQFGLSHYSKNLTGVNQKKYVLEDGILYTAGWNYSRSYSVLRRVTDFDANSVVLQFTTTGNSHITLQLNHSEYFVLSVDVKLRGPRRSALVVTLENVYSHQTWNLRYDCSNQFISVEGNSVTHGMNCSYPNRWKRLIRDLLVDLQKGIMLKNKIKLKVPPSSYVITQITLEGSGELDNLTLCSGDHEAQFYAAADWFINHQDNVTGGWAIPVVRKMAGILQLNPGWYSAMGQGHGLSLLSRAYHHSGGDERYLLAALKALRPFQVLSKSGGVLAMYLNEVPWYEEYPTDPPTMVLNGFIYALIGLYDLLSVVPKSLSDDAEMLYNQGMDSLKTLLLAYDTGSGTTYDLRHLTLGIAPKLARWDYHATHVNQLLLLATIDKTPLFSSTAKRWLGYMNGKRASHN